MALVTISRQTVSDNFPGSQIGLKMTPKCGLEAEKLLQGGKKEPARSPEANIVILAESSSKIWGGTLGYSDTCTPQPPAPQKRVQKTVW